MKEAKENTYKITNVEFKLNEDLDIDESVEASKLLNKLFAQSSDTFVGEFTGDEIERFLTTVLIPANGKALPEGFSFRKARESVQLKVFKDFFFARMRRGKNITIEFSESMIEQLKH